MHDQVMRSLRWQVRLLEEEEAIETALQRRIRAVQETQSSTSEIDIIMESMMEPRDKGLNLDEGLQGEQRGGGFMIM
jgi:hypothetical protein